MVIHMFTVRTFRKGVAPSTVCTSVALVPYFATLLGEGNECKEESSEDSEQLTKHLL